MRFWLECKRIVAITMVLFSTISNFKKIKREERMLLPHQVFTNVILAVLVRINGATIVLFKME